jgi:hypothetical protein
MMVALGSGHMRDGQSQYEAGFRSQQGRASDAQRRWMERKRIPD